MNLYAESSGVLAWLLGEEAAAARSAVAGVDLLSLDDRIRAAAVRLGFRLLPE